MEVYVMRLHYSMLRFLIIIQRMLIGCMDMLIQLQVLVILNLYTICEW